MILLDREGRNALADFRDFKNGRHRTQLTRKPGSRRVSSLTVKENDGRKFATVTDGRDKRIFEGPVDTPAQRAALPEDIRRQLEEITRQVDLPSPPAKTPIELRTPGPRRSREFIRHGAPEPDGPKPTVT
jgi:hypothetical protein